MTEEVNPTLSRIDDEGNVVHYRYIARIDNPLIVKASGFVPEGGLGEFDHAVYQEIVGDLPEGYQLEQTAVYGETKFG